MGKGHVLDKLSPPISALNKTIHSAHFLAITVRDLL